MGRDPNRFQETDTLPQSGIHGRPEIHYNNYATMRTTMHNQDIFGITNERGPHTDNFYGNMI